MATTTQERILDASAELFRRQGYTGTGIKQILAEASAPFGSLYHHFPGGKEQLGAEVDPPLGAAVPRSSSRLSSTPGPTSLTRHRATSSPAPPRRCVATDYADACPIATVALEVSSTSEPLREACADVFESWIARRRRRASPRRASPSRARASWRSRCSPRSRARSCSAARCAAPSRSTPPAPPSAARSARPFRPVDDNSFGT